MLDSGSHPLETQEKMLCTRTENLSKLDQITHISD